MRLSGQLVFTAAIAAAAAWALVATVGWPINTALYPRAVALPLLLLAVAETVLIVRGKEEVDAGGPVDVVLSADVPADVAARRTVVIAAWLVGFLLLVMLISFPWGVPLFVGAYVWRAREGPIRAILLAAFAWLVFYLLFDRVLHLPFPEGALWQILRR